MNLRKFFRLKAPCTNCPFLKVGGIHLAPGRLDVIKAHLLSDDYASFYCHKTTHLTGDEEEEDGEGYKPSGREGHCAGAAAFLLARKRSNIAMRLAFAEGVVKPADFDGAIALIAVD
ncbi:hypothetical protein WKG92_19775 [Pantoea agglomerans]|uniref:hypothetical protein n=1 Tax=Enterobacter agglomerans TaxID=549 RepID=UPI003C7D109D